MHNRYIILINKLNKIQTSTTGISKKEKKKSNNEQFLILIKNHSYEIGLSTSNHSDLKKKSTLATVNRN